MGRAPRRTTRREHRASRAPLGLLIFFLLAPLAAGCRGAAEPDEPSAKPGDFETRLVLKNAAGRESTEFQSGEPITLVVTIVNRSGESRVLTLRSSQTHDCVVSAGKSQEIWRWSSGRRFAQMITDLSFAPSESRTFTVVWDQTDGKGGSVPSGEYRAVGLVPAGLPGSVSGTVSFAIRAP